MTPSAPTGAALAQPTAVKRVISTIGGEVIAAAWEMESSAGTMAKVCAIICKYIGGVFD